VRPRLRLGCHSTGEIGFEKGVDDEGKAPFLWTDTIAERHETTTRRRGLGR
jgi:hypothetical protein